MKKQKKSLVGIAYTGFIGECNKRCPIYSITAPGEDGIVICDVLRKYFNKKVRITIAEP